MNNGSLQIVSSDFARSLLSLTDGTGDLATSGLMQSGTGFKMGGAVGFTGTKTAGTCVLQISGGIITNVTGC